MTPLTRLPILSIALTLTALAGSSQTVTYIQDKGAIGQLKRMTADQWNDWQPDPGTDFFGFPDNVYGWAFWDIANNSYYHGADLRPLKADGPYTQNILATVLQVPQDNNTATYTDSILSVNLKEAANMEGGDLDIIYSLYYSDVFSDFDKAYSKMWNQCSASTQDYLNSKGYTAGYQARRAVYREQADGVHAAYMQRGSRWLAYMKIEKEWDTYLKAYLKTMQMMNTYVAKMKK
jgi:hypothetical protein